MASHFNRSAIQPTAYAVICNKNCGKVFLTEREYNNQMLMPDARWCCPNCNSEAEWDDDNYESFLNGTPDLTT